VRETVLDPSLLLCRSPDERRRENRIEKKTHNRMRRYNAQKQTNRN